MVGGESFREMKLPGLSLAKRALRSRKSLSPFEFSADQIEAVRQLIGRTIAEVECELIIETLADLRGSRTEAAKLLGISIRTLRNKIREYGERGKIVPKPAAIESPLGMPASEHKRRIPPVCATSALPAKQSGWNCS